MRRGIWGEPSRRELLVRASRYSAALVVISLAAPAAACATGRAPQPQRGSPAAGLPRLPEGSPDFDLLNTLLQLEHRAASLASEARQGRRLGGRAARAVDRIIDDHRIHIAVLEQVITGAGATPGPPRNRYSLPTPLGDERRALGVLLGDETNLVSKYAAGLVEVEAFGLAGPLGSLLFSAQTHVAGLERILDRCTQPAFLFGGPWAPGDAASPGALQQAPGSGPVAPHLVLRGLSSIEASAGRICALGAERTATRFQDLEQRTSKRDDAGAIATPPPATSRLEVSGFCPHLTDAEGRSIGPASADLPTATAILEDEKGVTDDSRTVVSAITSLLSAMSSAHAERAAFWAWAAEIASASGIPADTTATPPASSGVPDELSPTAAGITEERLSTGDPREAPRPGEIFSAVQDGEIKTAAALAVAASNLASEELRSRIAHALPAVATATSRLVGLAVGDEFLVAEV